MTPPSRPSGKTATRRTVGIVLLVLAFVCVLCLAGILLIFPVSTSTPAATPGPSIDPTSATLTLAYSPEKANLIKNLVEDFNATRQRTPDRRTMRVELVEMPPDQMVDAALSDDPAFQALSPDASLWLDLIDQRWAESHQSEAGDVAPRRIADSGRYAVSPIVIATWPDVAQSLGWGSQPVSWLDIQNRAATDKNFRWSHASTSYASGMLATLAEFYAGTGKTRGLTSDDVNAQPILDYVAAIERTISFYGENEAVAMQRLADEGPSFLDALVVQEALVVQYNLAGNSPPLVAIYPHEGTLWEDHPLALLDIPTVTDNQRRTFQALRDFLLAPEQQKQILALGYRPADLNISIDGPDSPISAANGVDPKEPQTTLQVPGPSVIEVVQNVWWYTKRHTNVFLVVDTSGSMRGDKLENVRAALSIFLSQIRGQQEQVGMVEFSGLVYNIIPLEPLDDAHRRRLQNEISGLDAGGDTALLDAVRAAYVRLQKTGDRQRINAIVVLTDGRENASNVSLRSLTRQIQQENKSGVPVIIFAIAYGDDAAYNTLRALAEASGGQVRTGDLATIRELYRLLSQYF